MDKNMQFIAPGIYLVRSQAGFLKALKTEFSAFFEDWRWMAANRLDGYPSAYPAVVSLSIGYVGDTRFQCNFVHIESLRAVLTKA